MYLLKIEIKDEKGSHQLQLKDHEMLEFISCVKSKNFFWFKDTNYGIYFDIDKILRMDAQQFNEQVESPPKEPKPPENPENKVENVENNNE